MNPLDRIAALERRLASLEAFLASQGYEPETKDDAANMAEPGIGLGSPARPQAFRLPVAIAVAVSETRTPDAAEAHAVADGPATPPAGVKPGDAVLPYSTTPPPLPTAVARETLASPGPTFAQDAGVERTLGLKVAGWIGAIVLAIGAALGVKYAYDQKWLGGLPDEVKLGLLYTVAAAVLGVGEWVYRRVHRAAAVGVYATGVASLFVISYAGNGYYQLYDASVAFFLMAGSCVVGAIIALRGGLVSIAVLSLLGANIAPLVLSGRTVGELPLLAYVLALQVLAVTLAYLGKGDRWWTLRTLSLVLTNLWIAGRLANPATTASFITLGAAALYFFIFQAENALSAARVPARPTETGRFSFASFSLLTTAIFAAELYVWGRHWEPLSRAGLLVGLGMLMATAGSAAFGTARHAAHASLRWLGLSGLVQASLLFFFAIAVALSGPALTFAWAALGVAYAILGRGIGRRETVRFGIAVWCIAAGHALLRWPLAGRSPVWFDVAGLDVTAFLGVTFVVGLLGHVLAGVAQPRGDDTDRAVGVRPGVSGLSNLCVLAAALLMTMGFIVTWPSLPATLALVTLGWAWVGLWAASGWPVYASLGLAAAGIAMAKWTAVDVLGERTHSWDASLRAVVLNRMIGVGVIVTVSQLAIARITRAAHAGAANRMLVLAIIAGFVSITLALSVEVERMVWLRVDPATTGLPPAQQVQFGWTILWVAAASLMVPTTRRLVGDQKTRSMIDGLATTIVSLCAMKFLLLDSVHFAIVSPRAALTPVFNLQSLTAGVVVVGLLLLIRIARDRALSALLRLTALLIPLVTGTIELDRQFGPDRTQVSWSVYWGVYAIGTIVLGFAIRSASSRFLGLALLGITLLKIVFVDLANAGQGWRVLSFIGVGTILLATSVLYGKVHSRGRGQSEAQGDESTRSRVA